MVLLTTFLGRAPTAAEIANGIISPVTLARTHNTLNVPQSIFAVSTAADIQTGINNLSANGGGVLNIPPGFYTLPNNITIPSSVVLNGAGPTSTIFNCAAGFNISSAGSNVYTTGTITVASGVHITGTGTLWLANAHAGQQLFLGTRWYLIAAVTSDTTLILAEAYGDNVTLPSTYRIATIITDTGLQNLAITGALSNPYSVMDARRLILSNVQMFQNAAAASFTNISEFKASTCDSVASSANGVEMTNVGEGGFDTFAMAGNTGKGLLLNNVKTFAFTQCACDANGSDGVNVTTGSDLQFYVDASGNGANGINFVSGTNLVRVYNSDLTGNTGSGLKLTATSDTNIISLNNITGNGAYGINIADASCDNNLITSNQFAGNSSAAANDSGTGTLIRSNKGLADN